MSENGCKHLNNFKAAKGVLPYRTIHSFFVACTSSEARRIKWKYCYCYTCKSIGPRLHCCFHCVFFGCYASGHIRDHAELKKHFLAVDLSYGNIYCFQCGDYVYDSELIEVAKEQQEKANKSLGIPIPFKEWKPSNEEVELFRKNPRRRKLKKNTTLGLRGLLNLGNTCFINCIVQTLTHTPLLREFFLAEKHICQYEESTSCLACEVSGLFQEVYSGEQAPLLLDRFLCLFWVNAKHLSDNKQQDAHEFFITMLNVLHKHCKNTIQKRVESEGSPSSPVNNNNNNNNNNVNNNGNRNTTNECICIVDQIFTGILQSDVICQSCKGVSTTVEPFHDISLDIGSGGLDCIDSNGDSSSISSSQSSDSGINVNSYSSNNSDNDGSSSKNDDTGHVSLVSCLDQFTRAEILISKIKCSKCETYQTSTKQLSIQTLPVIACFHLKRFQHLSEKKYRKISTDISFPAELDMTPYMSHRRTSSCNNSRNGFDLICLEDNRYSLFAVVNHIGSFEGGHYTVYIRQQADTWFKCDDHIITRAKLCDVLSSEGYLLFYHKQILEYD